MYVSFLSGEFCELCLNKHGACWPAFQGKYSTFLTSMSFCCIGIAIFIVAVASDMPVIYICRTDIAGKHGNNTNC